MSDPDDIVAERPINVSSSNVLSGRPIVNSAIEIHMLILVGIRHLYRPGKLSVRPNENQFLKF